MFDRFTPRPHAGRERHVRPGQLIHSSIFQSGYTPKASLDTSHEVTHWFEMDGCGCASWNHLVEAKGGPPVFVERDLYGRAFELVNTLSDNEPVSRWLGIIELVEEFIIMASSGTVPPLYELRQHVDHRSFEP